MILFISSDYKLAQHHHLRELYIRNKVRELMNTRRLLCSNTSQTNLKLNTKNPRNKSSGGANC